MPGAQLAGRRRIIQAIEASFVALTVADLVPQLFTLTKLLLLISKWVSVDVIATYLGIKRSTAYKWIERRDMPAHKVSRLWKFRKEEVHDWVRSAGANDRGGKKR